MGRQSIFIESQLNSREMKVRVGTGVSPVRFG